jgi:small subunit ribosomal protein S16
MAVRMRLRRVGRKHQPTFRIVVADSEAPRDGRFIELLGHYYPRGKGQQIELDKDRVLQWLGKGAKPSETVAALLRKAGCFAVQEPGSPIVGA